LTRIKSPKISRKPQAASRISGCEGERIARANMGLSWGWDKARLLNAGETESEPDE